MAQQILNFGTVDKCGSAECNAAPRVHFRTHCGNGDTVNVFACSDHELEVGIEFAKMGATFNVT